MIIGTDAQEERLSAVVELYMTAALERLWLTPGFDADALDDMGAMGDELLWRVSCWLQEQDRIQGVARIQPMGALEARGLLVRPAEECDACTCDPYCEACRGRGYVPPGTKDLARSLAEGGSAQ